MSNIISMTSYLNAKRAEAARASMPEPAAAQTLPAYCDPDNEFRGSKYEATKGMSLKEVAKRIRQDVKQMIAAGTLPKGLKVSVRMDGYNALRVNVTEVPAGLRVYSEAYARATKNFTDYSNPDVYGYRAIARYTAEFNAVIEALDANTNSYNRDNSDIMTDYFDVRFYDGRASLDWRIESEIQARESVDLNS